MADCVNPILLYSERILKSVVGQFIIFANFEKNKNKRPWILVLTFEKKRKLKNNTKKKN